MPDPLLFWVFSLIMFAVGFTVGFNWRQRDER